MLLINTWAKLASKNSLVYAAFSALENNRNIYKNPFKTVKCKLTELDALDILECETLSQVKSRVKMLKGDLRDKEIAETTRTITTLYQAKCSMLSRSPWESALIYKKYLTGIEAKYLTMIRTNSLLKPYQYLKNFQIQCIYCFIASKSKKLKNRNIPKMEGRKKIEKYRTCT